MFVDRSDATIRPWAHRHLTRRRVTSLRMTRFHCHCRWLGTILAACLVIAACDSRQSSAAPQSTPTTPAAADTNATPSPQIDAAMQTSWTPDALDELLAPIALY